MRFPLTLAALAFTVACTPVTGEFPLLGVRPVERRADAIVAPPVVLANPDATVAERIVALAAQAAAGRARFDDALGRTRAMAAAAGNEGSESWVVAQLGLTALDDARAATVEALAEVDRLLIGEYAADRPVAPATAAIGAALQASADDQSRAIAAVQAALAR